MNKWLIVLAVSAAVLAAPATAQDEVVAKAKKARDQGNHEEAVNLLEAAYETISGDAEALRILSDAARQMGDPSRAMDYAVKAVDLDKSSFDSNRLAALAFEAKATAAQGDPGATSGRIEGLYEDALAFADAASKLKPQDVDMLLLRGRVCFNLSRFDESAAAYRAAAETEPAKRADHLYLGARSLRLGGAKAQALELIDAAIAAGPTKGWLHLEKGHVLATPSGEGEAVSDEDRLKAAESYGKALAAKELDQPTVDEASQSIHGILGTKERYAEAQALIEGWAKAHPEHSFAHWWLGYYLGQQKKDAEAAQAFAKSWDTAKGQLSSAAIEAGKCLWRLGELEKAAEWMVKASKAADVGRQPAANRPAAHIALMSQKVFEQGPDAAVRFLEKYGLAADPNDWSVLNFLGLILRDQGDGRSSRGKELCAKSAAYYVKASQSVLADEEATETQKAAILNDTGVLFHFPQYQINDVAKGVEYYRKALEHDPAYVDALENLGLCMNLLGKFEEAVPLFEKVLAQQPGRPVSVRGLKEAKEAAPKR